ncbi:MAG: TAXI family TRAP transporter solute-binding subunit [Desulfobacterales bacterium]|nr:TAXI family TRAP transporter solute-binding subunit [Desulfobacterales bacterium]
MVKKILISVIALSLVIGVGAGDAKAAQQNLIIATATTGGTYYPVGVALGTLISIKLASKHKITATAINSAGSGENVQMLKNKEAQLAILQGIFGAMAYKGKALYEGKPMKDFQTITMLWQNIEHFIILKKYAKSGDLSDLKGFGQKFSIGQRGSGTEGSGKTILSGVGIECEVDFTCEYLGYNPSAQAMMDGRISGANIPGGVPVAAVTQLFAQMGDNKVKVLDVTDEQIDLIYKAYPLWSRYVIPKGTYPGQKSDINTIAQPNVLAVIPEVPEDTIYLITKTIYENLPFLHNIHKATKAMKIEKALSGLPAPLHPGAVKYYKEIGLKIPDHLMPN